MNQDGLSRQIAQRQLSHATVLLGWKYAVSRGLITTVGESCPRFVPVPPPCLPLDNCSDDVRSKRLQVYDTVFAAWEKCYGAVMYALLEKAAAAGKVRRYDAFGSYLGEKIVWEEAEAVAIDAVAAISLQ